MKRRYSNFHRARKYFRKYRNRLRYDNTFLMAPRYRDLYEHYDTCAYLYDGVNTGFDNVGEVDERLIIRAHFNPTEVIADLQIELKYRKMDISKPPVILENDLCLKPEPCKVAVGDGVRLSSFVGRRMRLTADETSDLIFSR